MSEFCGAMQRIIICFEDNSTKTGEEERISKKQVSILLRKEFPDLEDPICKDEAEKVFQALDADSDGVIDFTEFVAIVTQLAVMSQDLDLANTSDKYKETELRRAMQLLKEIFKEYATKGENTPTMTNKQVSDMLHKEFPKANDDCKAEIEKVFEKLDADKNGVVTFQEFVALVTDLKLMLQLFYSM